MNLSAHDLRWLLALALTLAYALMCLAIWRGWHRQQQARQTAARAQNDDAEAGLWIVWASQSGLAQTLAEHMAACWRAAGHGVRLLPLGQLSLAQLASAPRVFFIASTHGEGDAPDMAAAFVDAAMRAQTDPHALAQLRYGLLALGDANYAHFCGFGRTLDHWLRQHGAQPLFDRIDANQASDADSAQAWARWQQALADQGLPLQDTAADPADSAAPSSAGAWQMWTLHRRQHLNPGSQGQPVYHLELLPAAHANVGGQGQATALPHWQSGDLAQVRLPGQPDHPRDYSIASIPADGSLHLLVRQQRRPDGTPGAASHWLTQTLQTGDSLSLRLRSHRGFHLTGNEQRPLILIGNGTGLAGLRSHLKARVAAGQGENWLIFGERQAAHDALYAEDLAQWQAQGWLTRLDAVYSRDPHGGPRYVQDALLAHADTLRQWLQRGAAVYVCGSQQGMATGVDTALRQTFGDQAVNAWLTEGRYRRDVY